MFHRKFCLSLLEIVQLHFNSN